MILMRQDKPGINGLKSLISHLPDDIVGLEVGCYAGESTRIFAESGKFVKLYCLDFWKEGYYQDRTTGDAEREFDKLLSEFPFIEKIKADSREMLSLFKNINLDFVYIDADHSYEQVKVDINNAIKLSPRFLAGHDYVPEFPGVMKAVDELIHRKRYFADSSWLVEL